MALLVLQNPSMGFVDPESGSAVASIIDNDGMLAGTNFSYFKVQMDIALA
jgi:hypothetical protein